MPIYKLMGRLWFHLGGRRQWQFIALLGLTFAAAFAEVVSLGSVLPFLSILIDPDRIMNYPLLVKYLPALGISTTTQLALPLTIGFIFFALVAGSIRLLLLWANTKFAFSCGADLSSKVYKKTLYQPYHVHISRNTSEVISGIVNKINSVVNQVISPALALLSSIVLMVAIMCTLIFINPMVAISAILAFGLSYYFITRISRGRLRKNSARISYEETQVIKALQEGLGGIRDVLLDGTQAIYCSIFQRADIPLRRALGNNNFIGGSPRFIMEAFGISLIAILAYWLGEEPGGIVLALPVLGALALGAQRLLPAMQQGYSAWATIMGSKASLVETISLLDQPLSENLFEVASTPLQFKFSISFNEVYFRYSDGDSWVLHNLNLVIPKGSRVGIIGTTGSGKSTAIDLLMGLLSPSKGIIAIDGNPCVGSQLKSWQKTIAHVPQMIYLADTSIAENIAFGVPKNLIDIGRILLAARQAHISDYVESLSEGYDTNVGERGVRLSGGQRQRIGIARALYKRAKVLIFDEATSALDTETELSVMESIDSLDRDLTIILVAHRITTLSRCDKIIELEQGRVKLECTYQDLLLRPARNIV
jgi:ABC-type multidrug transport system fused ATPase/permease subunit